MYLHPDLDTFEIFPWRPQQGKVARLICDVYRPDGGIFEGDPRHVFQKVLKEAEDMRYRFLVEPECEFFLLQTDEEGTPSLTSREKAGDFDVSPLDCSENVRRDIILNLEDMGIGVMASYHEKAPAQHEIDMEREEGVKIADNIMTFKMATRTIAKRHGHHATFMPKPRAGVNGSGMHLNITLLDGDGRNVFADTEDERGLSETAYFFINGLLSHMQGLSLLTNPLVNSYKRLVPGFEAPVTIGYATSNRSAVIRIPAYAKTPELKRFELRSPDATANPYYAYAAILMAGLDGMEKQIDPQANGWGPYDYNLYELSPE